MGKTQQGEAQTGILPRQLKINVQPIQNKTSPLRTSRLSAAEGGALGRARQWCVPCLTCLIQGLDSAGRVVEMQYSVKNEKIGRKKPLHFQWSFPLQLLGFLRHGLHPTSARCCPGAGCGAVSQFPIRSAGGWWPQRTWGGCCCVPSPSHVLPAAPNSRQHSA